MSMKSVLAISLLSMIVTTGMVHTPETFADDGQRATVSQRLGHGGSTYSSYICEGEFDGQFTSTKIPSMADSERIGHGGSLYSVSRLAQNEGKDSNQKNQRVIAMERIGHGGSTYYSSETMRN